jgi:hypothetical protein
MKTTPKRRRVLLTEEQAADLLGGIPLQSLRDGRNGRGSLSQLGFYKLGRRVRYDEHEVLSFIEAGRRDPAAA